MWNHNSRFQSKYVDPYFKVQSKYVDQYFKVPKQICGPYFKVPKQICGPIFQGSKQKCGPIIQGSKANMCAHISRSQKQNVGPLIEVSEEKMWPQISRSQTACLWVTVSRLKQHECEHYLKIIEAGMWDPYSISSISTRCAKYQRQQQGCEPMILKTNNPGWGRF